MLLLVINEDHMLFFFNHDKQYFLFQIDLLFLSDFPTGVTTTKMLIMTLNLAILFQQEIKCTNP